MKTFNETWRRYITEIEFDTSNLVYKGELNDKFWEGELETSRLKEEISTKLFEIAANFAEEVDILDKVKDVTFTGSMASFGWHNKSDIDLHILVDYNDFEEETAEACKDTLTLKRIMWNQDHKIMIMGHEVEIYVQDINEPHHSTGVYSIQDDKWIAMPIKENPEIDVEQIINKAESIVEEIDAVSDLFLEKKYRESYEYSIKLKEKLRKLRSSGLEKDGVYSIENMAFKVLRNNGYLQKLSTLKTLSYDKMMSVGGNKLKVTI